MKLERGSWRNDMRLKSVGGGHDFRVFMRKSEDFPENFIHWTHSSAYGRQRRNSVAAL
jgi:hypothetical protein